MSFTVGTFDFVCDSSKLPVHRFEDQVRHIVSNDRLVRRNRYDVHVVDVTELFFLRLRCTGHSGKLRIHPEEVLVRDRRKGHGFALNLDAFLRFDRLVQTFRITTTFHDTTCELVDDHDFVFANHIVDVAMHDSVRPQCEA